MMVKIENEVGLNEMKTFFGEYPHPPLAKREVTMSGREWNLIADAIEKQIPKKVIVNKDGCRNCPMEKFEALEILRNMVCTEDYLKEMQKISCNALEKQIPKKVIVNKDGCRNCPNCYANESWICYEQDINEPFEYCANCGQKLDWGNNNEKQ